MGDPSTGECKGVGWLTIGDPDEAQLLVDDWNDEPFNKIDGRRVIVSKAVELSNCAWQTRDEKARAVGGTGYKCKFGAGCSRRDCTFQHPDGWDPSKVSRTGDRLERLCKFAEKCSRVDCFFQHPEGWDPSKNLDARPMRECRIGRSCTFKGCFYTHPDGRDCDDAGAAAASPKKKRKQMDDTAGIEAGASSVKKRKRADDAASPPAETAPSPGTSDMKKKKKKRDGHVAQAHSEAPVEKTPDKEPKKNSKAKKEAKSGTTDTPDKAGAKSIRGDVAKGISSDAGTIETAPPASKKKRKSREATS